jgi:hypothetical protein
MDSWVISISLSSAIRSMFSSSAHVPMRHDDVSSRLAARMLLAIIAWVYVRHNSGHLLNDDFS